MKKMMLTFIYALMISTYSISGEGNKTIVIYADSSEDVVFTISSEFENQLHVFIKGQFDESASLSVITARGKSVFYEFVDGYTREFDIDLSNLENGVYYVKLEFNGEIRLKTIVIK
jgi:YbbR domain-containing protein